MLVAKARFGTSFLVSLGLLICLAPASACSKTQEQAGEARASASSTPSKTYSTRGKVRAIGEKRDNVTIAHEDIPGYMKAMSMMFDVEKSDLLKDINVDDQVAFTFSDRGEGKLVIESLTKAK